MSEEVLKAFFKAQQEFPALIKDAENSFFKSKYADLPSVLAAVNPILWKHGLFISQPIDDIGDERVVTHLIHAESGETLSSRQKLHLTKLDPQAQGSAITYARRYSILSLLGIAAIDDDAEGAMNRQLSDEEIDNRQAEREKKAQIVYELKRSEISQQVPKSNTDWRSVKVHWKYKDHLGKTLGELEKGALWFLATKWKPGNDKYPAKPDDLALKKAAIEGLAELENSTKNDDIPF